MRKAIAVAVAAAVLTGGVVSTAPVYSSTLIQELLIPTPLGIILKASKHFIERNRTKVYYVQVESEGKDFEEAKNKALRVATEHAVGVVVSSQRVIENHEVVRNEIVAHSSGYVHDWQTVSEERTGGKVRVTLDVWVSYLHLSERIVVKSSANDNVDGEKITDSRRSFERQQATGRQLLEQVLRDYPEKAMNVKVSKTEGFLEGRALRVQVNAEWSSKYVGDLVEAIKQTTRPMNNWGAGPKAAPGDRIISVKMPNEFFIKFGAYDPFTFDLFQQHFFGSPASIQVILRSSDNKALWTQCYQIDNDGFFGSNARYSHMHVAGNGSISAVIDIEPRQWQRESNSQLEETISRTRRVEAQIVRSSACR